MNAAKKAPCPLAVMDGVVRDWRDSSLIVSRLDSADAIAEARAAVAELVAADREVDAARLDGFRLIANAAHPDEVADAQERVRSAERRRAAALAKFGGAA